MLGPEEQALEGGAQTVGVVRVGDTVRRPLHARSRFVHRVLRHLEAVGFAGAPRVLGVDECDREILTYIPGQTIPRAPADLTDRQLTSAAQLIRGFHDATAGTVLAGDQEAVRHGDLGSHNIVFDGDLALGLIDWGRDVAPGSRLVDFAHAVWCCADVCETEVGVHEQARRVRVMCDAYGGLSTAAVVDEITARFARARTEHAAAGRSQGYAIFDEMAVWMKRHGAALKA